MGSDGVDEFVDTTVATSNGSGHFPPIFLNFSNNNKNKDEK